MTSCPFVDNLILRLSSYSSPVPMKWEEERAWKQVGKMIGNIHSDIRSKYITIHRAKQFCMEIKFKKFKILFHYAYPLLIKSIKMCGTFCCFWKWPVSFLILSASEGLILCHFAFFRNEIDSSVGKKAIKEFFIQMKKAFNDMVGVLPYYFLLAKHSVYIKVTVEKD